MHGRGLARSVERGEPSSLERVGERARRFGSDNRARTWAEFLVSLLSIRFVSGHKTTPVGTAKSVGISLLVEGTFWWISQERLVELK